MSQRIFCVDDSKKARRILQEVVEEFGHEFLGGVSSVENLHSWLHDHEAKDITISIINLSLRPGLYEGRPDEGGAEALRILDKAGFRGGVIWSTSFPIEAFSEEVRRTEFPVLPKPFDLENLEVALLKAARSAR